MANDSPPDSVPEQRSRCRSCAGAEPEHTPFGDLAPFQQVSVRLAQGLTEIFAPMMPPGPDAWAEPLRVQRWADYRAGRSGNPTAWIRLNILPDSDSAYGCALLAIDGDHLLALLDRFFGGEGKTEPTGSGAFTPAAEALALRIAQDLCPALALAWQPVLPIRFQPPGSALCCHVPPDLDRGEMRIVTRFGLASGESQPDWIDLLYPVAAFRIQEGRIYGRDRESGLAWRTALARAAMAMRFPVRVTLAEPEVPLAALLALKVGDTLPIAIDRPLLVMVAGVKFGHGQAGTTHGRAAVKLAAFATRPAEVDR